MLTAATKQGKNPPIPCTVSVAGDTTTTTKLHTTRCGGFEASSTVSHHICIGWTRSATAWHVGGALSLTEVQIHSMDKKKRWISDEAFEISKCTRTHALVASSKGLSSLCVCSYFKDRMSMEEMSLNLYTSLGLISHFLGCSAPWGCRVSSDRLGAVE